MAKDAGLSLEEITSAYEGHKTKPISKVKNKLSKKNSGKSHAMKGVKLSPKYKNSSDPNQTWTGRGVDPSWVSKLREAGMLETALIQSV
jgi:DNA-binding protein H-NS